MLILFITGLKGGVATPPTPPPWIRHCITGPCTDTYMLPLLGLAQIHTCCHYWALHRYVHAANAGPCTDTYMLPLLGLAQIHTCCHCWALHRYIHAAITGPCTDTYMHTVLRHHASNHLTPIHSYYGHHGIVHLSI